MGGSAVDPAGAVHFGASSGPWRWVIEKKGWPGYRFRPSLLVGLIARAAFSATTRPPGDARRWVSDAWHRTVRAPAFSRSARGRWSCRFCRITWRTDEDRVMVL